MVTLKTLNTIPLAAIAGANALVLVGILNAQDLRQFDWQALLLHAKNVFPVGVGLVVVTVLNGVLSPRMKARLVHLRWQYFLPSHRMLALAREDSRVDLSELSDVNGGKLPTSASEQNALWWRWYRIVQDEKTVTHAHRISLLMRDYTGFAFLFLVAAAVIILVRGLSAITTVYLSFLFLQLAVVRLSAANYGERMVMNVLVATSTRHAQTTASSAAARPTP